MGHRLALALVAAAIWTAGAVPAAAVETGTAGSLIIDVNPLDAQVRTNGFLLGTGRDVMVRPVYVRPGEHVLEFTAPGYAPAVLVVPVRPAWGTRVSVDLVPERKP